MDVSSENRPNKGGRPPYEPTDRDRKQVRLLSGMGVPDYDIAKVLMISQPTLRKYFAHELEIGHIEANAAVAHSLYKQAVDSAKPNVTAAIFWLKTRARWVEALPETSKKAQAHAEAQVAQQGTTWESLLLQ